MSEQNNKLVKSNYKVVFTGSHGTGKTTLLNEMKSDHVTITEVVRRLAKAGVKINEAGDMHTQELIWCAYESEFDSHEDFISDRSFIDVLAYTYHLYHRNRDEYAKLVRAMEVYIKNWIEEVDPIIVYFPIEFGIDDDGIRSCDPTYQKEVDGYIRRILDNPNIVPKGYYVIRGSVESRKKQLLQLMNEVQD